MSACILAWNMPFVLLKKRSIGPNALLGCVSPYSMAMISCYFWSFFDILMIFPIIDYVNF